jgi:tetratricopeptide (TPR) repeat protein
MNDINKVLNLNPKSLRGYTLKGTVLFKTGKRLQSLEAYEEALNIDTTNISLCNYLAQNYLAIGSARKAIKLLNRAMSMDAENAGTIGNLGWAWYISNDDQKCIEYSKKAITINPKTYFARFNLALATLRSGNISEARKLYSILKDEAKYITLPEIDGAKKDLNELMARGKNVNEIKSILAEFF